MSLGPKNVPLDITEPLNFYEKTNKAFRLSSSLLSFSTFPAESVNKFCNSARTLKAPGLIFFFFLQTLQLHLHFVVPASVEYLRNYTSWLKLR